MLMAGGILPQVGAGGKPREGDGKGAWDGTAEVKG